jgi:hypothetical protein
MARKALRRVQLARKTARIQRRAQHATPPTADMVVVSLRKTIRRQVAELQRRINSNKHGIAAAAITTAFATDAANVASYIALGQAIAASLAVGQSGQ